GQSRSDAIFQLVQGKTPARPTETPGATAWLNLELRRYRERIPDPAKARLYGEVAEWQDTRSVPPFFAPLRDLLASPLRQPQLQAPPALHPPADLGEPAEPPLSLRALLPPRAPGRPARAAALAARQELPRFRPPLVRRHPEAGDRRRPPRRL